MAKPKKKIKGGITPKTARRTAGAAKDEASPSASRVLWRLRRGLARIRAGWCQHDLHKTYRGREQYCARGACFAGVEWRGWSMHDHVADRCEEFLDQALPIADRAMHFVHFNNTRTKSDVVALFERAITLAKAGA